MRTISSFALLVLIVFALPQTLVVAQDKAKPEPLKGMAAVFKASELIQEGKAAEAVKVLDAAKGTVPAKDEWKWWQNKGTAHAELCQDDKAIVCYREVLKLNPKGPCRTLLATLLQEADLGEEALDVLNKDEDPRFPEHNAILRVIIEGPFKARWPLTWPKLHHRSKGGNYVVISDIGVTDEEMDALEAEAAKLDPNDKLYAQRLAKFHKPHDDLVSAANLMELSRKEFMAFAGISQTRWPKGKRLRVFFFRDQSRFMSFEQECGGRGVSGSVLGYYTPMWRYISLFNQPGGTKVAGNITQGTIETFWHEGWHQTCQIITRRCPLWMNEGIAEFLGYGTCKDRGTNIELGLLVRAKKDSYTGYELVKEMIRLNRFIPFKEFFYYESREWNTDRVSLNYAQAWSIVYFALRGDNELFKKDFCKIFAELCKDRPAAEVIPEVIDDKSMAAYEAAWIAYWKRM
ncbi:MAG TPA: DUF1570 domain-containing protein [Planctomycetota bacterium]|nr:DUF1570 domain-containing protein [Planctomycetota bacterium]